MPIQYIPPIHTHFVFDSDFIATWRLTPASLEIVNDILNKVLNATLKNHFYPKLKLSSYIKFSNKPSKFKSRNIVRYWIININYEYGLFL